MNRRQEVRKSRPARAAYGRGRLPAPRPSLPPYVRHLVALLTTPIETPLTALSARVSERASREWPSGMEGSFIWK